MHTVCAVTPGLTLPPNAPNKHFTVLIHLAMIMDVTDCFRNITGTVQHVTIGCGRKYNESKTPCKYE